MATSVEIALDAAPTTNLAKKCGKGICSRFDDDTPDDGSLCSAQVALRFAEVAIQVRATPAQTDDLIDPETQRKLIDRAAEELMERANSAGMAAEICPFKTTGEVALVPKALVEAEVAPYHFICSEAFGATILEIEDGSSFS